MGKDYLPLKVNGYDLRAAYAKLKHKGVDQASNLEDFHKVPSFDRVEDIEIGIDGTRETILRLKDGGFCVLRGTVDYKTLKRG